MLHLLLYGVLALALAGALFAVAARFLPAGEQIAPAVRDEPPWELPSEHAMQADDVDAVRLPVALRGYRFAETDLLLDRLAGELRARDAEIARLRGGGVAPAAPSADERAAAQAEPDDQPDRAEAEPDEQSAHEAEPDEHPEDELAVGDALDGPQAADAAPAGDEQSQPPAPSAADGAAQSYPTPAAPHPDYAHAAEPPSDPADHWAAAAPPWAVPVSTAVEEPAAEPDVADPAPDGDGAGRRRQGRRRRRT